MANHKALSDEPDRFSHEDIAVYRNRERTKTLAFSDGRLTPVRGEAIIEAIRFNRDFAVRDEASREAACPNFMDEVSGSEGPRI